MSGLEVFSAVAATTELIKIIIAARDRCQRGPEKSETLERARSAATSQLANLRLVFDNIALTLNKYHTNVEHHLDRSDRAEIRTTLKGIKRVADETREGTIPRFSAAVKQTKNSRDELTALWVELNTALATISNLQTTFQSSVSSLETLRRLSSGQSDTAQLTRRDTSLSTASTLTRTPTSSTTASKSSTGSSGESTSATRSIRFNDDKKLRDAILKQDISEIEDIVEAVEDESEIESRKASALLLACRYRRRSIVKDLLSKRADTTVTDKEGLGVLHNAIGTSDSVDEAKEKQVVEILELLVEHHAPVEARDKSKQKQTPLHYCARSGNYHAAKYILGVDLAVINIKDAKEKTALYHACEHGSPNVKLVRLLLKYKATFATKGRPTLTKARHQHIEAILNEEEKERKLSGKG
ncbi:MAG: hypothetical protein Q9201_003408 [Fulgogasparrea decipioides]